MPINVPALHRVQAMLEDDSELGVRLVLVFQSMSIWVRVGSRTADDDLAAMLRADHSALNDDLSNILTVLARLAWDLEQRDAGSLPEGLWIHFSRLDVESFFVLMRSAADHVGGMLAELSLAPKSTPRSFSDLREHALNPKRKDNLGPDVRQVLLGCPWYEQFKEWRELIVHEGGLTLTFPERGRLLFQVYRGPSTKVIVPGIMYNDNVVDLGSFITLYISNLLCLVEDVAVLVQKRLQVPTIPAWRNHPALSILRSGVQQLIAAASDRS